MAAEAPVGNDDRDCGPELDAAKAGPSPWLPAEDATMAWPGSSSSVADTAARPPRTLNEPVGWSVSTLTDTRRPRLGDAHHGRHRKETAHRRPSRLPLSRPGELHVAYRSSLAEARLAC